MCHDGSMSSINLQDLVIPDDEASSHAADAAAMLASYLRLHPSPSGRLVLCVDDSPDTKVTVPAQAFRLFIEVLDELAKGNAVTVAPIHAELTTQQAADLLNVSRPFLVGLLESGEIPFRKVGSHRRIRLLDVLAHQRKDEQHRQSVYKDLTHEAEELGLYSE